MARLTAEEAALAARTLATYEREAAQFDARRARVLFERAWLARFSEGLPPGATVLDVGCGAGEPIGRFFVEQGFALTGLDGADAMLSIARSRLPEAAFVKGDMRDFDLKSTFSGVLAWDSFFHLTAEDQTRALPRMMAHVAPGGRLMLTVGPRASTGIGTVGSSPIFHESLSLASYAAMIEAGGLLVRRFVADDPDCDFHSVLLAERPSEPLP